VGEATVRVGLLGTLEVEVDGRAVDLRAARQRSLLARLACDAGTVVSDDLLIDHLWGAVPPASARGTMQTYVFNLRQALGPAVIERDGGGYRLVGAMVDVESFVADVDTALALHDPAERVALLDRALARWRGRPLEELGDGADAVARRSGLEERQRLAVEARAEARLALGEHAAVVADLERHVVAHPLRERAAALLMVALYRSGRQAEALAAHRNLREHLVEELGLEPGPELRQLEQQILAHDPSLLSDAAPSDSEGRRRPPSLVVQPTVAKDEPDGMPPVPLPGRLTVGRADDVLVGRRSELARLMAAAHASAAGGVPPLVVLRGEAGIGKTRLARELALIAGGRGEIVLWGRCPPDTRGILEPWAEALDHLVRHRQGLAAGWEPVLTTLLPSLAARETDPLLVLRSGPEQGFAVLEAVSEVLARAASGDPVTVVVDDLQWADPASLALLEHVVARRLPGLLVVATVRRPDAAATATADEVLLRLTREGWLEVIDLQGLSATELRVLVDRSTGGAADDGQVATLHAHTKGNPFFVHEVVAALGDDLAAALVAGDVPLTAGVQAVLDRRLQQLGPHHEVVLAVAAALGDEFDLDACATCAERVPSDVLDSLERAIAAGLLEEGATADRFAFPHALIRSAVAHRTSRARRAVLAERVDALRAARDVAEPDGLGRRVAGRLLGAKAVRDEADADATTDAALAQSRSMLTRIAAGTSGVEARPGPDPMAAFPLNSARAGRTVLRLAQGMIRRGEREPPRRRAIECAALARRLADPVLLSEAALTLASAEGVRPGPGYAGSDELREMLGAALRDLGDDDGRQAIRAQLLTALSCAQPPSREGDARDLLSAAAVVAAERGGDPQALAGALLARRGALREPGSLPERRALAERALVLTEAAGSTVLHADAVGSLGADLLNAGRFDLLDPIVQQGLDPADRLEAATGVTELFSAGLLLYRGQVSDAVACIERATTRDLLGYGADLAPDDSLTTLLLVLSIEQGTLGRSRPSIDAAASRWPHALLWQAARATAALAGGDEIAAGEALDVIAETGIDCYFRDSTHLAGLALCTESAARIGHPLVHAAGDLVAAHVDPLVLSGVLAVLDPRLRYVGLALAAQGRWSDAVAALRDAATLAEATQGLPAGRRLAADLDAVAARRVPGRR